MAYASFQVKPGSPDVPETVEIDCAGLDPEKHVDLMLNDEVLASGPVAPGGNLIASYKIPDNNIRLALADVGGTRMTFTEPGTVLCACRTIHGDRVMLRYRVT